MIYVVIPVEDNSKTSLEVTIQEAKLSTYKGYVPNVFLVDFKGTSLELCEKLGIGDPGLITGLVVPLSGYYGYARADFWQWIKANG